MPLFLLARLFRPEGHRDLAASFQSDPSLSCCVSRPNGVKTFSADFLLRPSRFSLPYCRAGWALDRYGMACSKMSFRRCGVALVVVLALLVSVSSDVSGDPRKYIATTSKNSPPFSFLDHQGNPQGMVIDFWSMWAEKMGLDIEFRLDDGNRTPETVRDGEADFHAGLYSSDIRHEYLDFSTGYLDVTTSISALDKLKVNSLDELGKLPVATSAGYVVAGYLHDKYPRSKSGSTPTTKA